MQGGARRWVEAIAETHHNWFFMRWVSRCSTHPTLGYQLQPGQLTYLIDYFSRVLTYYIFWLLWIYIVYP